MPRKKLRKQRISIRRESSLLSKAGPPFLGFISDRSASLLCSVVVSRLSWDSCYAFRESHHSALCRFDVTEAEEEGNTKRQTTTTSLMVDSEQMLRSRRKVGTLFF